MRLPVLTIIAALAASACDEPKTPPLPGPEADGPPPANAPPRGAVKEVSTLPMAAGSLPPMPDFIAPMMRKTPEALGLKRTQECEGNFDNFNEQFGGSPAGVSGEGWAWNTAGKAPFGKYLVLGPDGVVHGGGAGSKPRPDVLAVRKDLVNTDAVGWTIVADVLSGELQVMGFDADAKTICPVGKNVVPQ